MTDEEPIFRIKSTEGHLYLGTEDWTNQPDLNAFKLGVITYQKDYPEKGGQPHRYVSTKSKLLSLKDYILKINVLVCTRAQVDVIFVTPSRTDLFGSTI